MIIPQGTGQLVQLVSLNKVLTVYVTDSPLSVTKIAELAKFYLNWPVLLLIPKRMVQLVQLVSLK